jgi:putative PEP-CTERM system histidine kinase
MMTFGFISYLAAILSFAGLALLLWISWRRGALGLRFIAAALASTVWAAVAAWGAVRETPALLVYSVEMLRTGAWLFALVGVATHVLPTLLARLATAFAPALLAGVWVAVALDPEWATAVTIERWLTISGIVGALLILVLIEQIYRNANATGRYRYKFLIIGLGGVFAYDLFLYSQAELFQHVAADSWFARGFVNALLTPFVAIAARRNRHWSLDVFVSRQAVLFTSSVVAVGVYLLVMALGGYYVREFGGTWGVVANLLFVMGALIVLAVVMTSGAVRRRARVFVHKHFYRNKFDYRVEWLRFVTSLSTADETDARRSGLQAMAQVFESESAILFARSSERSEYVPAAAWPMDVGEVAGLADVPDSAELVRLLRDRKWVVDLREYAGAPEAYQNMELPSWLAALQGYRVIAPLLHPGGMQGFVILGNPPGAFELTYEDRDLLLTMGRHVALILMRYEAERRLAESRQFEAYNRLTAFMMHDLKNLVAQLDLVTANAVRHRQNPEFVDDAFATVANAAGRMSRLIEQLRRSDESSRVELVELRLVLEEVLHSCGDREPRPQWLATPPVAPLRVRAERDRIVAIFEHVIRNAQDASAVSGKVTVRLLRAGSAATVEVTDEGTGMTAEFIRERLFRPFDSTKGSKGMGIGAYQVREYARAVGGEVEVQSSAGAGTTFVIRLPLHE